MAMSRKRFLRFGGAPFHLKATPREINRFVSRLPEEKSRSLFEIVSVLRDEGLIEIESGQEMGTVDQGFKELMEGEYARYRAPKKVNRFEEGYE